jgi:UDP-N-acetylmuramate dehydrogenase
MAITGVELELAPGDPGAIRREMLGILAARRKKFPKNLPNCGSTFLSDPAMYATVGPPGRAIEAAGLKGAAIGGAQVSTLHANFIVNRGGATSDEVLALIAHVRETVFARTGYRMDCEARFVTETGEERPAHEFTDAGRFDRGLLARLGRAA